MSAAWLRFLLGSRSGFVIFSRLSVQRTFCFDTAKQSLRSLEGSDSDQSFCAVSTETVPVRTVNRQCSSGLQAVADVVAAIKAGFYDIGEFFFQYFMCRSSY